MRGTVRLGVLIAGLLCICTGGEASAKDGWSLKPKAKSMTIAAMRVGLTDAKIPLIGARLVRRGGYTPLNDMVRQRFVGGVVDIYPSTKYGFRLSVGTRYFARTNFWLAAEQATNGLLYDPHMTRGGRGLVRNFRRYTPVALVGYDVSPANGLVIGLEGGAMNGRAIPTIRTPRLGYMRGGEARGNTMNQVVTLSARLAF